MGEYYYTDPNDPDAPVELTEYKKLKVGMNVAYHNPRFFAPLPSPLVLSALYDFKEYVTAILNNGEFECSADNLVEEK